MTLTFTYIGRSGGRAVDKNFFHMWWWLRLDLIDGVKFDHIASDMALAYV